MQWKRHIDTWIQDSENLSVRKWNEMKWNWYRYCWEQFRKNYEYLLEYVFAWHNQRQKINKQTKMLEE